MYDNYTTENPSDTDAFADNASGLANDQLKAKIEQLRAQGGLVTDGELTERGTTLAKVNALFDGRDPAYAVADFHYYETLLDDAANNASNDAANDDAPDFTPQELLDGLEDLPDLDASNDDVIDATTDSEADLSNDHASAESMPDPPVNVYWSDIEVSYYSKLKNTRGTRKTLSTIIELLDNPSSASDKNSSPLFSSGCFKNNSRASGAVMTQHTCIVLDLDDIPTDKFKQATTLLTDNALAYLLYTTFSHQVPDRKGVIGERYRIVVPLATPCATEDYAYTVRSLLSDLRLPLDRSSTRDSLDPKRCFYMPVRNSANPDAYESSYRDGQGYAPSDTVIAQYREGLSSTNSNSDDLLRGGSPDDQEGGLQRIKFLVDEHRLATADHDTWYKLMYAYASVFPDRVAVPEELVDLMVVPGHEDYSDRDTVRKRLQGVWDSYDGNRDKIIGYGTLIKHSNDLGYAKWANRQAVEKYRELVSTAMSRDALDAITTHISADSALNPSGREELLVPLHDRYSLRGGIHKTTLRKQLQPTVTVATPSTLPEWGSNIVYIVATKKYRHLANNNEWDEQSLNTEFRKTVEVQQSKGQASTLLSSNPSFKSYADTIYAPGEPREVRRNNAVYLNTYNEGAALTKARAILSGEEQLSDEAQELIDLYERHIGILFPRESDRDIWEDFVAYRLQNQATRINYAIIVQGPKGIGKSTLGNLMRHAFGNDNCGTVNTSSIMTLYTDWAEGKIVSIVDEIRITGNGRYEVMERLKSPIADNHLSLNIKFRSCKEIQNHTNYVLFTNYPDAVPIDDSDRRYAVLFTGPRTDNSVHAAFGGVAASEKHFSRMAELIKRHPEAMALHWLRRDVSGFNPKAHAPMTEAKRQMAQAALPSDEFVLNEYLAKLAGPVVNNEVIDVTLIRANVGFEDEFPNIKRLAQILKGRGYTQRSGQVRVYNEKHRYWISSGTSYSNEWLSSHTVAHLNQLEAALPAIRDGSVADIGEYEEAQRLINGGRITDISEYEEAQRLINDGCITDISEYQDWKAI